MNCWSLRFKHWCVARACCLQRAFRSGPVARLLRTFLGKRHGHRGGLIINAVGAVTSSSPCAQAGASVVRSDGLTA